jgi:hypothetical protein
MSVSGSLIGDNGLQTVRVTKKFWNSRKTFNFTCSLTQALFHPGSQIDLAGTTHARRLCCAPALISPASGFVCVQ